MGSSLVDQVKLRTRSSRLFLVLFIVSVGGFSAYQATHEHIVSPDAWYFYTVARDNLDIESPTQRVIIDRDIVPSRSEDWAKEAQFKVWDTRCFTRKNRANTTIQFLYRDVNLCNSDDLDPEAFEIRESYFKVQVDELYSKYWSALLRRTGTGLSYGIGMWTALLGAFVVGRWILGGDKA